MFKSVASLDAVLGQEVEESHQSGISRDGGHSRPPTRLHTQLNSFSLTHINTQSRLNGSRPFNSQTSSPLHSSVHQSPYSPSYLSSSFTQRDLLNGASPYHSLGGASSGNHVNSNGVTNGISPYQSVGGVSDSYHVNGNFSVHTTPPTRDYSSKPHPTSENSCARRHIPHKSWSLISSSRVRISEPSPHDDYISRLENLQQTQRDGFGHSRHPFIFHCLMCNRITKRYFKVKVISSAIGVRSREPCYNFAVTVTLTDLDLHWLHAL